MWVERWIEGDRNARMRRDAGADDASTSVVAQGRQARGVARHRVLDRRRLDHVLRRRADAWWASSGPARPRPRSTASPSCSPPPPICWPAGRASRCAPTCARGRASSPRCSTSRASSSPTRAGAANRAAMASATAPRRGRLGDCVDCRACVHVCPTGIDIRDGIQLECINCGLCIDACNDVMDEAGRPTWLITWDTLARQKAKAAGPAREAPPVRGRAPSSTSGVLVAAIDRDGHRAGHARARSGCPCSTIARRCSCTLRDGSIRNGYTVKIVQQDPDAGRLRAVA